MYYKPLKPDLNIIIICKHKKPLYRLFILTLLLIGQEEKLRIQAVPTSFIDTVKTHTHLVKMTSYKNSYNPNTI